MLVDNRQNANLAKFVLLSQVDALSQRSFVLRNVRDFWSVADQQLLLNCIIDITREEKHADVDTEERREPT